jgi:hypothetical protein
LTAARERAEAVAAVAAKVADAVSALANEPSLETAAEAFASRAKELAAAVGGLETSAADSQQQERAAAEKLAAAESAHARLIASRITPQRLSELERADLTASHALSEARYEAQAIESRIETAKALLAYRELAKNEPAKAEAAWSALVERWTIAGQVAMLKPLSPEQMTASALTAAGMLAPYQASAERKIEKSPPESLKTAADNEKVGVRTQLVGLELLSQLRNLGSDFVRQYGGLPGQDFQATVNQALFFGNGGAIEGWLKPQRENLVARLSKVQDPAALADALYLSVFSRPPTSDEAAAVAEFLQPHTDDRAAAVAELAWALLSSTEFRFNH